MGASRNEMINYRMVDQCPYEMKIVLVFPVPGGPKMRESEP